MQFPQIESVVPNLTVLRNNGVTIWYSYQTPIAFRIGANPQVVLDYTGSKTTSKHLKGLDGDLKKYRVSQETFDELYNKQLKNHILSFIDS